MRQELTRLGVQETRAPEEVDALLAPQSGTVMMVINSMCGCAAGRARPGIALALRHTTLPDKVATVFAGGDLEATRNALAHEPLGLELPQLRPTRLIAARHGHC